MTAQPQTRPMPGAMLQPYAPAVEETAPRTKGTSRSASIALILSLLLATGGVSFAVGRMSVDDAATSAGSPFAAGALPAAAAGIASSAAASTVEDTSAAASTSSSTGSGPGQAPALAAAAVDDTDTVPQLEDTLAAEADAPLAPPDEMMVPGAGRPGGTGGVQGTVAEITAESLTVTAADGSSQTFVIDGATNWVQQETIAAADVQSGDAVSVQVPFAGPRDETGDGAGDGSTSTVATQVTVTTPAA